MANNSLLFSHSTWCSCAAEIISKLEGSVTVEQDKKLQGFFARMETRLSEVRLCSHVASNYDGVVFF